MLLGMTQGNCPTVLVRALGLTAANSSIILPANAVIDFIVLINNNANAVTGGLKIGTTLAGSDIVAAQAVAGNSINVVSDAALLKRMFSQTATQQIFVDAVSAWNSANVDLKICYSQFS